MENVMNKLSKTAMKTYRNAAEATNRITREIKLKANMADNKSQINDLYEKIGKKVYEKYLLKEDIDMQDDFNNECSMIDVLANEIEDFRMQLLNLKDLKPNISNFINKVAPYSLGIYLIHGIFLDILRKLINLNSIPSLIAIPIFTCVLFIISYFSIKGIKQIPKINKYIC